MSKPKWLEPDDLPPIAQGYWDFYASGLYHEGRLTTESAEKLKFLCRTLALARAASAEIEAGGVVIGGASGSRRANPACKILLDAEKTAERLMRAFGLVVG